MFKFGFLFFVHHFLCIVLFLCTYSIISGLVVLCCCCCGCCFSAVICFHSTYSVEMHQNHGHTCNIQNIRIHTARRRRGIAMQNNDNNAKQNKCRNNRLLIEWYLNARATICPWIFTLYSHAMHAYIYILCLYHWHGMNEWPLCNAYHHRSTFVYSLNFHAILCGNNKWLFSMH